MLLATLLRSRSHLTFEFIRMISLNIHSLEGKIIAFLLELHCISIYAWKGRQKHLWKNQHIYGCLVPDLHIKGHQNANVFKPAGQSNHVTCHEKRFGVSICTVWRTMTLGFDSRKAYRVPNRAGAQSRCSFC